MPDIEALAKEFAGRATVVKLDIDTLWVRNKELVERFKIQGLPLVIIFKDGQEVTRLAGADQTAKASVHEALQSVLAE